MIVIRACIMLCLLTSANPDSFAKTESVDSLIRELNTAASDSMHVNILNKLCKRLTRKSPEEAFQYASEAATIAKIIGFNKGLAESFTHMGVVKYNGGDYEEAIDYYAQALAILKELNNAGQKAKVLNNIGVVNLRRGKYDIAVEYFLKSLKIKQELGDKRGIATCMNNIAIVFEERGDYDKALDYNFQSLKTNESLNNKEGIARSLNNIGVLYRDQGNDLIALEYYRKSLKIKEELEDNKGIAMVYNNIGVVYDNMYDKARNQIHFEKAMEYYFKSLKIRKSQKDKNGIADNLNNLGTLFEEIGEYDTALVYYGESMKIRVELGEKEGMARCLNNMAEVFENQGNPDKAIEFCNKSLSIASELGTKAIQKSNYFILALSYEGKNDYKLALANYKLYTEVKDSLFNENKSKEIGKLEAKYDFEKALEERERLEAENLRAENESKQRRNNLQYSGILIFLVLSFALVFMLGRISVPNRLAEGMIFFSFLLFFEFTLVLLDPYIDRYSSGAPAIKLGFNALLAGLIFPLHSFIETKLKGRIVKS
ncbi:MAG: hypothetical protein COB85_03175 [Bacteroidetes bacterium]|nr:MAG: hypothetical protein COB85_03175 [Bacteroidota bacterium]